MQEQAHYNLGNTIAKKASLREDETELMIGDVEDAIEHYNATLELNPDNEPARFNRDALIEFLENLKRQSEAEQQKDQAQSPSGEEGEQSQPGSGGQNQGEGDPQSGGSGQSGQAGESGGQSGESGEQADREGPGEDPGEQGDEGGSLENQEGSGQQGLADSESEEAGGDDGELEGKLEAADGGGREGGAKKSQGRFGCKQKKNAKTGMNRSEARQLLRALSDEDLSVRPVIDKAVPDGRYKDW